MDTTGHKLVYGGIVTGMCLQPYIDPVAHPVWSCAGLAFPAFLIVNLLFLVFWLVIYRKYALLSFLGLVCSIGAIRTYFPVNVFVSDVPEGAIKFLSYNTMAFEKNRANTKDNPNLCWNI